MNPVSSCWCGNRILEPFSAGYLRCFRCETLVAATMPAPDDLLVQPDETGFYGRSYFESYQKDSCGLPTIMERARTDLSDRCLYWLRSLLKYKLPPGRTLELGSSHGAFVGLLQWTGFHSTGLELSPWVAKFAERTFGVPMLLGPIENQDLEPATFDALILMDVLEHLADPAGTMAKALLVLKPGGIVLIQTPCYAEGKTLEAIRDTGDPFVQMLLPDQHLFLFSRTSVRRLLEQTGAGHLQFEQARFPYDMFLCAGSAPLECYSEEEIRTRLDSSPSARLSGAALELFERHEDLRRKLEESEADRTARLKLLEETGRLLRESDADRTARLKLLEEAGRRIAELDVSQDMLGAELARVSKELEGVAAIAADDVSLREKLTAAEEGRATAVARGEELKRLLEQAEAERGEEVQRLLAQAQADRAALTTRIEAQSGQLSALQGKERLLERVTHSYVYKCLHRIGLWHWLEPDRATPAASAVGPTRERELRRVVVDLTPVLPGGENGGAKVMTLELIRQLSRLAPECRFILLTSRRAHDELADLDCANVERLCVEEAGPSGTVSAGPAQVWKVLLRRAVVRYGGGRLADFLYRSFRTVGAQMGNSLVRRLQADLLFCPFTAPFYYDPTVPAVSVVYDLQHVYYPQFFSPQTCSDRDYHFQQAARFARRLVCISDYVRNTVIEHTALAPDRVSTVHISVHRRLRPCTPSDRTRVRDSYGLATGEFLLYPANFWQHKNHEVLLTAFGIYRARHPQSELKLVLTGADCERKEHLRGACEQMRLAPYVVFPGYVSTDDFSALLNECLALIFPSLYEGFGIPVLEAMEAGKPVLCSTLTSLPETAGDAALLFDPRRPAEIVSAIERIEDDPELVQHLIARGRERASAFGNPEKMAAEYLRIFKEVAEGPATFSPALHGVHPDGWSSERVTITYGSGPKGRHVMLQLYAPDWFPGDAVTVRLIQSAGSANASRVPRGKEATLREPLPAESGFLDVICDPLFQPSALGLGQDTRWLGCQIRTAKIVSADGAEVAL